MTANPTRRTAMRQSLRNYPTTFYFLLALALSLSVAGSLCWPFLTIYLQENLHFRLSTATALLSLEMLAGVVSVPISGALADHFGRRKMIILGLGIHSLIFLGMAFSRDWVGWVFLMILAGVAWLAVMVGIDAIVTDLIDANRRSDAYTLLYMAFSAGWAIGPTIGGILASESYQALLLTAAVMLLACTILSRATIPETRPKPDSNPATPGPASGHFHYGRLLRDQRFLLFCGFLAVLAIAHIMPFILGADYAKTQFGLSETKFGLTISISSIVLVLCGLPLNRWGQRFPEGRLLSVGALFYVACLLLLAIASTWIGILVAMTVIAFGEILVMPNSTTYVSKLAPPDQRGHYLGFLSFVKQGGFALGPILGGVLSDQINPQAMWYSGALLSLIAALGFALLAASGKRKPIARQYSDGGH